MSDSAEAAPLREIPHVNCQCTACVMKRERGLIVAIVREEFRVGDAVFSVYLIS